MQRFSERRVVWDDSSKAVEDSRAEEIIPISIKEKGDTLAHKSRESPPPQGYRPESANRDLEGYWKHPAPGPGCGK
eukprot:295838-Pelagomonas_calceolata.AAC.2